MIKSMANLGNSVQSTGSQTEKVKGSMALFIQNVRNRKVRLELARGCKKRAWKVAANGFSGQFGFTGDPHTRQASPLPSSYSPGPRDSFSG